MPRKNARYALVAAAVYGLFLASPPASWAGELTVTVAGIETGEGKVWLGVFDSPSAFPDKGSARAGVVIPAEKARRATAVLTLRDLPPGRYAIAAIHDVDGDGELDTGLFGVPSEPYGFANDARGIFGPPAFEDAAIDVGTARTRAALTLQ